MGVVYEAEQVSLGRHVAVKVLASPRVLDPKHVERFHREARAAARLHHTNIVPVFGVGEQDGLHYYVMQYIEGKGLDFILGRLRNPVSTQVAAPNPDVAATPPAVTVLCPTPLHDDISEFEVTQPAASASGSTPELTVGPPAVGSDPSQGRRPVHTTRRHFRRAARVALQVAEALHYAHGQGVLHRDIKPANLLVDGHDIVWVLDFGLAKVMEQDDLTQPGEVAGTLRYAPPERFRGKSDARSDIYSLGLTLYEMVTLRPAFDDADHGALLGKVMHQEPPPPRSLNPQLPRDLETVLLKAIARDPDHRYQTAAELADDLRRFLDDKPVLARRVGPLERFRRWCRRNPVVAGLTATAAVLLVLVAAVASAGYVSTSAALSREADQRRRADDHRRRAEANLTLSMEAFEEIFQSVTKHRVPRPVEEGLEDGAEPPFHPVVSPEVAALLQDLLKFYDQFGELNTDDPSLQRHTVRAHSQVGDLQQRLGQWDKAEAAYRRAIDLYRRYGAANPNELVRRRELAGVWNELGTVYQMTGRLAQAEEAHRNALKVLQDPPPQGELKPPYRFELVRAYTELAHVKWKQGRALDAVVNLKEGLDGLEELRKEEPTNAIYRLTEAQVYRQMALLHGSRGQSDAESDAVANAVRILDELDREFPAVPEYRYELSETLAMLDTNLRIPKLRQEAEARFRRAVELATDLTRRYPSVPEFQASLARSQRKLGVVLRSAGKDADAEKAFRLSVDTQRGLVERFPKVPDYEMFLAESQLSLGELLRDRDRLDEAKAVLAESIAAQENVLRVSETNLYARRLLGNQYRAMADTLLRMGETAGAEEMRKKADEYRLPFGKEPKG
jgi:serine/threonine protein kinase